MPNEAATPRMVTLCEATRPMVRPNKPAMTAASSGTSAMARSMLGLSVFTRSALQGAHVFDVDGAAFAEQHHQDGESDGRLGRGHGQHEEHEYLAVDVI